jgi:sec-independent protein translocase protein TatC
MTEENQPTGTEKVMSFWDHLEELRWRVIKAIIAVLVGGVASIAFSDSLLQFLLRPAGELGTEVTLVNLTPLSMIMVRLYIALVVGLLVGLPVVSHQMWMFIRPGLHKHERGAVPYVMLSTLILFSLGAFLSYSMMPYLLRVLVEAGYEGVSNTWNIREYVGFLLGFMAAFGVVFELPVVIYMLSVAGIVSPAILKRYRRYGIVIIFIVAAFLTPSPDPFSQLAMALPMLLLFEASIIVSSMVWKAKAKRRLDELDES